MRRCVVTAIVALALVPPAHAAAPRTRILYMSNWTGHTEVFAVDPARKAPVAQLTHWQGGCPELPPPLGRSLARDVVPSPDGRYVLAQCGGTVWLMRANGDGLHEIARSDTSPRWSRNSKQFVYTGDHIVHIVDVATEGDRLATPGEVARADGDPMRTVSPNRRWVATFANDSVRVDRVKGARTVEYFAGAFAAKWSPDGRRLAVESRNGIRVFDTKTLRTHWVANDLGMGPADQHRVDLGFGFSWSPNSRAITYVTGEETLYSSGWAFTPGDVKTTTLTGTAKTVVNHDRPHGGRVMAVAWARLPRGTRYRRADAVPTMSFLARGSVDNLAADGPRVAFIACEQIVVWEPSTGAVDERDAADLPKSADDRPETCSYMTDRYFLYDLALAGTRAAYALTEGCNSIRLTVHIQRFDAPPNDTVVASSGGHCGGAFPAALGRLAGADDLLVFGQWHEQQVLIPPGYTYPVDQAAIYRIGDAPCPCEAIASTPGPLYPADVDGGRVAAFGTNQTLVFDSDGSVVASVPVSPQAVQLSGNDLVLVVRGQLREYDLGTGALLHAWPLRDVPAGPLCGWIRCSPQPNLVLNDVARGRVAYTEDGRLHVLRLADGSDTPLRQASLARFMDDGLAYADGVRVGIVPWASLP